MMVGAEMVMGGWSRNKLREVIQNGAEKRKSRYQGRNWRYHKIINNNLHIHINVKKSLCQIEYFQTKSLFKKICFEKQFKCNQRKPLTCRTSLTNFITSCTEYTLPWTGFKLTTLVVIGTDCIGSCKSNYHTIMTMTAPPWINT